MAKTREHKSSKPLARGNTERKSHPMIPMIDKTISLTMQDINKFRQMLTM